jgi:hypothetical protein
MKKFGTGVLVLLLMVLSFCASAQAQGPGLQTTQIRNGTALPTCNVTTRWTVFILTSGTNAGLYLCRADGTWATSTGSGGPNQVAIYDSTGKVLLGDALLTDSGTLLAYTGTSGIQAKSLTTVGNGTAGNVALQQGTGVSAGQCGSPPANCIGLVGPPVINTPGWFAMPGQPSSGLMHFGASVLGTVPGSTSGDANHADSQLNQTGSILQKNLCVATAGGCSSSGLYEIVWNIRSTSACATPGSAGVTLTIGWTDDTGGKTFIVPQVGTGSSGNNVVLGATGNFGQGTFEINSTGAVPITYLTTATACTSGTLGYSIDIATIQVK